MFKEHKALGIAVSRDMSVTHDIKRPFELDILKRSVFNLIMTYPHRTNLQGKY